MTENKTIPTRERIAARQYDKDKEFWLNQLADPPGKSTFYYDFKPSAYSERPLKTATFQWDGELFSRLTRVSNQSLYRLYMILAAGLVVLVNKYTGSTDVMIGTPVYKQDVDVKFINTVLVLRNPLHDSMTFKELLLQMRETISAATDHVNYPVEILAEQLGLPIPGTGDFPLFDISILLENIHDKKYISHINHNICFTFQEKENFLQVEVTYNSSHYYQQTVRRIITHYSTILNQVLFNVDLKIPGIEILSGAEKTQLLYGFNNTGARNPESKTIHRLFAEQVEKNPGKIAVCSHLDRNDIFTAASCFKKNNYLYESDLELFPGPGNTGDKINFKLVKTHCHNSVIMNKNMLRLIDRFDGKRNLESIFFDLKDLHDIKFIIYSVVIEDLLEVTHNFNCRAKVFNHMNFADFISLVQLLYENNVIELAAVKSRGTARDGIPAHFDSKERFDHRWVLKDLLNSKEKPSKADVLLLGDTPGIPTTGLLYLAAFLERNGIKSYCRFYDHDRDYPAVKAGTRELLHRVQPKIVAISMKWFLYISRALDMCRIVREYSRETGIPVKIVVGGNTASFYWAEIITYECIDFIIRGDGELPLLKICRGEKETDIPNCVYRKDGKIIQTPMTYIKDETNSPSIYLSHADEIMIPDNSSLLGTFFIYTHLGCMMNCCYCGGCRQAQQKIFNRKKVFRRGVREVRKDIQAVRRLTSTFQFDFDIPAEDLLAYCSQIWSGIDLSNHFCIVSTLEPLTPGLVRLVSQTFKYIYWDLDITTLSERHRKQLASLNLVKPQLTDDHILAFMDRCEQYPNIEVRLNLITGLPYFNQEDIEPGERFLYKIMNTYSCFGELHWARLHAQPGAPIIYEADKHDMHSYASTFADFLRYSQENFNENSPYPGIENMNYPYVYYKNDPLNSTVTNFYLETNKKLKHHRTGKKIDGDVSRTLTYRELNEEANRLARVLRTRGVSHDNIVGLMVTPSLDIPIGILAILKAGGAYLPIDPESPAGRIKYMLKDSNAGVLVTTPKLQVKAEVEDNPGQSQRIPLQIIDVKADSLSALEGTPSTLTLTSTSTCQVSPANLAYIIYTSGSTGKPKGALLTHENLANYAGWFTQTTRLTEKDKTILTSSFAFDLGYTSLFPSLLQGGQLHLVPRDVYLPAEELLKYIKQKKITYIKVTPSLLTVMVNSPFFSSTRCESLRLAVVGGEPINLEDVKKLHDTCPHIEIMNHYGPTEATIGSVAQFIDFSRFEAYRKNPTIGQPITNVSVYILDKKLRPVPIGVPGELCISGQCLARGYLNRPELTARKFDQDLWDDQDYQDKRKKVPGKRIHRSYMSYRSYISKKNKKVPGKNQGKNHIQSCNHAAIQSCSHTTMQPCSHAAMQLHSPSHYPITPLPHYPIYLTGDLSRWLPNGTIEFLGRLDNQTKIRGYRIELGEIENRLLEHPQIKDAVVIERKDKGGSPYLCAYYVPGVGVMSTLTDAEKTRYSRQMLLEGWGEESQQKLKGTTVFVAGAGGGASPVIVQLALAGFGTIIVCDHDSVELSNLNRQFLHQPSRIGMNKALSAKMTIEQINPNVTVIPITKKLTRENASSLIGDAVMIFDMFDDPECKFILSQCALEKDIPHIIAAMTDISSYAVVFHPPRTPCFHCIFDKSKLETLVSGMRSVVRDYEKNPLAVAAPSLFVSTGFVVNEAIKMLLGIRTPALNKFFFFNQGGTRGIGKSPGFRAMTYVYSNHFKKICREQGFDWDDGWSGNFLEEFTITPDINCPLCGKKYKEKLSVHESTSEVKAKVPLYPLTQLRDYLLQTLPEYMIPAHVVQLPAIPLTPNGKVDKKALPEPQTNQTKDGYTAPTNETEDKMAGIWSEVLGIPKNKIGIDDNFFQLGGHSLKVTQLVSRVHEEMNQSLPLAEIFTTPTIRELAKTLSTTGKGFFLPADENLVLLRKGTRETQHLFLIHAGSGEVEGYIEFCNHLPPLFNCWGIKTTRIENDAPMNITINEIARKYIKKIKKIQPRGPYHITGWCIGGTITFEMIRQLEQQQDEIIDFFALINTNPPKADTAGEIKEFAFKDELNWILELLPKEDIQIKKNISSLSEIQHLWPVIIDYLEVRPTGPELVRTKFPPNMAEAVPNFKQLGIKELIYYLNTARTYDRARNAYIPAGKNNTMMHFFGASDAGIPNRDKWNHYCKQPFKFYKVTGDHFSIFKKPHVEQFARLFAKVMMNKKI